MKNAIIVILVALLVAACYLLYRQGSLPGMAPAKQGPSASRDIYYCPMHPTVTSDKPGECPICHMSLVKRAAPEAAAAGPERKVLYYRNPMNPSVTSPVPMKDEMGMDYVPVYEEAAGVKDLFYISPQKQQLIGVKTGKVEKRDLSGVISTVGRVAYDPDLYVAQEEYLQAARGKDDDFSAAAKRKLLLMGMSEKEISEMKGRGAPEEGLYLPSSKDRKVWVYMTIYEYQAPFVKPGRKVDVTTSAFPGKTFKGKVVSIAPMVESMTRSFKVRALVDNPDDALKLEMYVNVNLIWDLGEKLSVPAESVMNAGTRTYVFRTEMEGHFRPVDVVLGTKAGGFYEVLSGLAEGDIVVTSGNFLIDSESKLSAGFAAMSEPNAAGGASK